jgi:SEC-C motif-containing protein
MAAMARCPCGSGLTEEECCDRFRQGPASAPTAAALMRSRFTAYVRGDEEYLRRTWHPSTRPRSITLDDSLRWTRLEILGQTGGSLFDTEGTVEFDAHYTVEFDAHYTVEFDAQSTVEFDAHSVVARRSGTMREDSQFVREDGQWLYLGPRPP